MASSARRDSEAKRPRGLEIDHELEFGRLNYGEVAGTGAFEHASGIDADLAIRLGNIGSIAHQTAGLDELTELEHRGHRIARRQCN